MWPFQFSECLWMDRFQVLPAKTKITDMVTIRHPSTVNGSHRTTLILLCEDGSLRIYMAGMEQTGFWFSPALNSADGSIPRYGKTKILFSASLFSTYEDEVWQ